MPTYTNRSFEPAKGTFFIVVSGKQVDGVYRTLKAANKLRDIIRTELGRIDAADVRVGHFSNDGKEIVTI